MSDKLLKLRQELASHQCDAILLNDLAEIAWLFNLRGSDVDCNPVFVAYALVDSEHATLFIHAEQVTEQVAAHLKEAEVDVEEYDAVCLCAASILCRQARISLFSRVYCVAWCHMQICRLCA